MQQSRTERMRDILSPAQKNNYYLTKLVRQYGPYGHALVHEFMWRIGTPTGMRSDSPEFAEHIRAYQTKYQNYHPTPNSPPANLDIDGYVNTDFRGGLFDKVMNGFLPDIRTLAQPGSSSEITSTPEDTMTHAPEVASSTTTIAPETAPVTPASKAASSKPSNNPSSIFKSGTVSNPANPYYPQNTPEPNYRKPATAPTAPTSNTNIFKQNENPFASAQPAQTNPGYRNPNPISPTPQPNRTQPSTPAHTPRSQPQPSSAPRENPQQVYAQYEWKIRNCTDAQGLKNVQQEIANKRGSIGEENVNKLSTVIKQRNTELLLQARKRSMEEDKRSQGELIKIFDRQRRKDPEFAEKAKKYPQYIPNPQKFRYIENSDHTYSLVYELDFSIVPKKIPFVWKPREEAIQKTIPKIAPSFRKYPTLEGSARRQGDTVQFTIKNLDPTKSILSQIR